MDKWEVSRKCGIRYVYEIVQCSDPHHLFVETDNLELAEVICDFLNQREAQLAKPGINEEETE